MGEEEKKEKRIGRKEKEGKNKRREGGRKNGQWADSVSPFQLFCVIINNPLLFYGD